MSSGSTCAVAGCHNNSRKLRDFSETVCVEHQQLRRTCPCPVPYSFHSMPTREERKRAWMKALRLKYPPKRVYVCSYHFVDKRPTEEHPDPELYLGYDRPKRRRKILREPDDDYFTSTLSVQADISSSAHSPDPQCGSVPTKWDDPVLQEHDYCKTTFTKNVQDQTTQCDEIGYLMLENNSDALLYTGIALEAFNILVSTLEKYASNAFTIPVQDQVLMTLMKLKNNFVVDVLSTQFHVSQIMASRIISYWIDKLDEVLRPLVLWLPKETIQATMPDAFKKNFPNTTCILDCSEIILQKPQILNSRRKSVRYLLAVAPCGLIMFISAAYGEKCGDKFITVDSGILEYLKPGDEIMPGQGLTMKNLLLEEDIKVVGPSFPENCGQKTEEQVTSTKQSAVVRFHVERAIRRLKVYRILSEVVSINMAPKIDKILRICAALVNLRP